MPSISAKKTHRIVLVVFEDAIFLDVAGPMQVFSLAHRYDGENYDIALVSSEGGPKKMDTGVHLETEPIDDWRGKPIDTLLIAGGFGAPDAAADTGLISKIADLASNSKRVASICTGAMLLAATGLLNGRQAVTHWSFCERLAVKHPEVKLQPDRIYTKDSNVWTSAGVSAGIDMALAMVAEDVGRNFAIRIAKMLVVFMVRPGGQSQFSSLLKSQINDVDGQFDALHAWLIDNLNKDLRVDILAEQVGMSPRNFARVYSMKTGCTPAKSVELYRVAAARDLLEQTTLSISQIAKKVGFEDDERLRRSMHRAIGISPKQCRERFHGGQN
ncbi:MAG: DJ-1/PfpI family protein [Pseudomonadota bacterium]